MIPDKDLPYGDTFSSSEEYISALLKFATETDLFRILTGGVHVLDLWTSEPGLFGKIFPEDWQSFLVQCEELDLLDLLMRIDLENLPEKFTPGNLEPPKSLLEYIRNVRRLCLDRSFSPQTSKMPVLSRHVAMGMKVKKVHEVTNFAGFVDRLCEDFRVETGEEITKLVDFGSGQNYLGRTLASPPYGKDIVAIEGRSVNIQGAKKLDVHSGVVEKHGAIRNKKLWLKMTAGQPSSKPLNEKRQRQLDKIGDVEMDEKVDIRPLAELEVEPGQGGGRIQYVSDSLDSGNLSRVFEQLRAAEEGKDTDERLMAMSIHSCGQLSHHAIRSLLLNDSIRAVAIVGCCYHHVTEKLAPPAYNFPFSRPSLRCVDGKLQVEARKLDPDGFPMSRRLTTLSGRGLSLNTTARMMACQSPLNWTEESHAFFRRHFYRGVLQRMFLDRGVILRMRYDQGFLEEISPDEEAASGVTTNPVAIGCLQNGCFKSFRVYIRSAIKKLLKNPEYADTIAAKFADITDEEIDRYEREYTPRMKECSASWSLMSFSAQLVEAIIVVDRWLFLKEQDEVVRRCWVETVFDYAQSPRNFVIVGIKK